jgi:hypothetical protein
MPAVVTAGMPGMTRAERALADGKFGAGVIIGLNGTDKKLVTAARQLQAEMRAKVGRPETSVPILTNGASQNKLSKNTLPSFALMLTPEKGMMRDDLADVRDAFGMTGPWNLCPLASAGCAAACLTFSGQSGMPAQQRAQGIRTAFLLMFPYAAGLIIGAELRVALKRHGRINLRLNTTSDIRWERVSPEMVTALTDAGVVLYDYTAWKRANRAVPAGYSLTYSAKEVAHTPDAELEEILSAGENIAMPFTTKRGEVLPATWHGFTVIDGDESDERYRDARGVVVGLRAKGHAWKRPGGNDAGFIRQA